MSETPTTPKRKIGLVTILSSLFIIFILVWGAYTLILIQAGEVRTSEPHSKLDDIPSWPYDINWAGGRTNWFENINYTDLPLDQQLPEDLLAQLNNTIFIAEPANPAQLWRSSAYDRYSGSGWSKTLSGSYTYTAISPGQATNPIYTISMNVSVSPSIEPIELPVLFPDIMVIENSFRTIPSGRLVDYTLTTDQYDTLLFSPLLTGSPDETVLIQYDVTYGNQDLTYIQDHALPGDLADTDIDTIYGDVGVTLSQTVIDEIAPFETVGDNAYDKAMAVDLHFRTHYQLLIDSENITERPQDQELTEWFIERGGGLPMDFATAYCVFMRYLNVPARVTIGYAMGEPDPDGGNFRLIQVKHMMFWVEVYIPLDDGTGEWIQVIPLPLPPEFAGGSLPENFDQGDVELLVVPSVPWAEIGTDFNLYAILTVNNVTVRDPENIRFYDLTDGVDIGITTIQPSDWLIPLANITYQFPAGATVGVHNITAMWISSTFLVSNFTYVVAVGQSSPLNAAPPDAPDIPFIPADTIDVDISLGLSNYEAHWNDTIHVHGIMTISGSPANGTYLAQLGNDKMWIMWDGLWYGNATIGSDGYYELDIVADGTDLARMVTGTHTISAYYAGAYDPGTGFPVVLPGSSADSTINLRGAPGFDLTVGPVDTYGGGSITYDGLAYLQNGTLLIGETIGILFDDIEITTVVTNSTGGFNYVYNIPLLHPSGTFNAQVNWTAPPSDVDGGTSFAIPVTIQSGATTLTIDSTPKDPEPVHIYETITIFGTLTVSSDGTPLVGRTVEIWWDWNNGTTTMIGTNTTIVGGYYEFTFTIPAGSEGLSTYWVEWDASAEPNYQDAVSTTMDITVKRYDLIVTIGTIQSSVVVGEELDIQGALFLPEFPGFLGGEPVTLWWQNGTGTYNITSVYTGIATGVYTFNYTVPITHELTTVQLWAEYISRSPALSSNVSSQLGIVVRNYNSYITVLSNASVVHLNESVLIYGYLEHENGTPLTGMPVDIEWNNGTSYFFPVVTNSTGWYRYLYNCSLTIDSVGTVTVTVYHTSIDPSYSGSNATLSPSLTLQLYQVTLDADVASNSVHLDEVIVFTGTLMLDLTGTPITGATVIVHYRNSTGTYMFPKITDVTGSFFFQYNCSLNDALGAVYLWAQYNSLNPLWDNAESLNRTVNLLLYSMDLTTFTDSATYYIDEVVHIFGTLTYSHNATPLAGQDIEIWWNNGTSYSLGTVLTDGTGYFEYYYTLSPQTDTTGSVTVWAEFTTSVPLWADADSLPGVTFTISKYGVTLDVSLIPNPVYLNGSLTIEVHLFFTNNATDIVGEWVSVWWDNGTVSLLSTGQTDGAGLYSFPYSNMDEDTILSVQIFANYTESAYLQTATSAPQSLLLERWLTIISGFDTGGVTAFLLTDTVVVTGTLYYDLGIPEPYGGVEVQILVNGSIVDTTTTASDGTFIGYWDIPDLTPIGNYDITVRYVSAVNWIADYETTPITVSVDAVSIVWTFAVDPNVVYRSEWLHIYGTLDLDNGSVYTGAIVTIMWENTVTATGPMTLTTVVTDGSGNFDYWYLLSETEELGLTQIWAECNSGVPIIAASSSPIELVDVMQIPVSLTATSSHSVIYLGDTITISGTLQFANGTVMVGYSIEIIWAGDVLDTILITDTVAGAYSYDYLLPWDESPRDITHYVRFVQPSEAYTATQTTEEALEIRDIITLSIDPQLVTSIVRGDTLFVSGTVTNGGGADAGVPIDLLVDGSPEGILLVSDTNGIISTTFEISASISRGLHNFSIRVSSSNYDVTSSSGYWIIQVNITSRLSVSFESTPSLMPGESFTIRFTLIDQADDRHEGETVDVYLNETYLMSITIDAASPHIHSIVINPLLWGARSGFYVAIVVYPGDQYVVGSSAETRESIHVFHDVVFTGFNPPYSVINNPLTLSGVLVDPNGAPIEGRNITLTRNDTLSFDLTTDVNGQFTHQSTEIITTEGTYTFFVSFTRADSTVASDSYSFEITSGLPPGFDTALLITWAVIVAIEAVVAMLIVARYRYKGRGFVIPRLGFSERASEIHDSLVR